MGHIHSSNRSTSRSTVTGSQMAPEPSSKGGYRSCMPKYFTPSTCTIITVRNEVAKALFLLLSVCPQGGGFASVHAGIPHTPCSRYPPRSRHPPEQAPPWEQAPPRAGTPSWSRHPPSRQLLLQTVRILLVCISVFTASLLSSPTTHFQHTNLCDVCAKQVSRTILKCVFRHIC